MNNKRLGLFALTMCCFLLAFGQSSLDEFNIDRQSINQNGMIVLGSWAITNLISSPIMTKRFSGSAKYFHQMNGYWNSVNLAIAGFGYYSAINGDTFGLSIAESIAEQFSMEKILLLNAGLDVAYITGGFLLKEHSKNPGGNSDRFKGFGNSLVLQGGFLLVFDVAMYFIHHSHSIKLLEQIQHITLSPSGIGMIWRI